MPVAWKVSQRENMPVGVYFYTAKMVGLETGRTFTQTQKMILTK
jgi:hypothetical protein